MPAYEFDVVMYASPMMEPKGYAKELADIIYDAATMELQLLSFINEGPGSGNPCFTFMGTPEQLLAWALRHYDDMSADDLAELYLVK